MDLKRAFRETTPARMLAISLIFLTDHLRMLGDSLTTKIIMESRIPELHKVKTKEAKAVAEQTEMVIKRYGEMAQSSLQNVRSRLEDLCATLEISKELTGDLLSPLSLEARRLPPLKKQALKHWSDFGSKIIMMLTDNRPQDNPVLMAVGEYRRDVYYRKDTPVSEIPKRKMTAHAKATEGTNIRDGIFQRIRGAYLAVIKEGGAIASEK
jgi:hypothetical protein